MVVVVEVLDGVAVDSDVVDDVASVTLAIAAEGAETATVLPRKLDLP